MYLNKKNNINFLLDTFFFTIKKLFDILKKEFEYLNVLIKSEVKHAVNRDKYNSNTSK